MRETKGRRREERILSLLLLRSVGGSLPFPPLLRGLKLNCQGPLPPSLPPPFSSSVSPHLPVRPPPPPRSVPPPLPSPSRSLASTHGAGKRKGEGKNKQGGRRKCLSDFGTGGEEEGCWVGGSSCQSVVTSCWSSFFGGRFVFEGIDSTRTVHISSHVQKEASLVVMMQVKVNKGTEARKQKDINNWRNPYDKASGPGFPLFVTCAHGTRRPCLGLTGKS